jgi:hypothetical protein
MIDPLSLSSGIAGLLSLAVEITKISYEYISGIKEAPKSVRAIIIEVTSLENILRDLRNKIVLNPEIAEVLQSLQLDDSTRVHVLQQCEVDLRSLLAELQAQKTSGIHSGLARLKWPFKEPEIQKKLERLQWLQSQLTTLTTHGTLVTSALTYKEVKDWRSEDLARKILEWLSPLDFNAKQHDMLSRRHPGTVQWILDSPVFKEWLDSDIDIPQRRTLWCAGPPGAGKTVARLVTRAPFPSLLNSFSAAPLSSRIWSRMPHCTGLVLHIYIVTTMIKSTKPQPGLLEVWSSNWQVNFKILQNSSMLSLTPVERILPPPMTALICSSSCLECSQEPS